MHAGANAFGGGFGTPPAAGGFGFGTQGEFSATTQRTELTWPPFLVH